MNLDSNSSNALKFLLIIFAISGAILSVFGLVSLLTSRQRAANAEGSDRPPAEVVANVLTRTPAPSASSTNTPPPPPTFVFPTANPVTPTPIPVPTIHLIIPVNPTPKPTPELPPAAPFPESCDGPGRMNILLIGVDGRTLDYTRLARADAIGVLGLNFTDRNAQLLSLPRDLWVQMNDQPENPEKVYEQRINTAYSEGEAIQYPGGGPAMLAATIGHNFGLRIDRHVVINFIAFENMVDAVGGIDIDVPKAIRDTAYPGPNGPMVVDIPAGRVHMDGPTALIYARTRHQNSDFNRMRRQQDVLMAIREKVLSPEVIPALPGLAQLALTSVRTDLSLEDVGLLGCAGLRIDRANITRLVVDQTLTSPFTTREGAQVLKPKMEAILPLLEAFNTGE